MVFIVALYVLGVVIWMLCLMLILSCMLIILSVVLSVSCPVLNLLSFLPQYVRSVGQDVSPGKCVLLSTSKSFRNAMKLWDASGGGGFLEG